MKTAAVAMPLLLVVAVTTPPAKLPLAPDPGAAKVTVTPLSGLLPESFTMACRLVVKAVLMVALCGVPAYVAMDAGVPGLFVSAKLAGAATPAPLAAPF